MSPWVIYWVMQADEIRLCVELITAICAIVLVVGAVSCVVCSAAPSSESERKIASWLRRRGFYPAVGFFVAILGVAFIPTTKSLCAILTIQVIANNETIQRDSREVYELGLERLKDSLREEHSN